MRWLVFLLVAANIAIYLWGIQREEDSSAESDPRYRQIGEIILLTKADIESLAVAETEESEGIESLVDATHPQPAVEEKIPPVIPMEVPQVELPTETKPGTDIEFDKEIETYSPGEENLLGEPLEETVSAATNDKNLSDSDVDRLAAEAAPMIAVADATEVSPQIEPEEVKDSEPEVPAEPEPSCWTLGPVSKQQEAEGLRTKVAEITVSAEVREGVEQIITGYWVVLPPYENAGAANRVVEQLKEQGVTDVQRFYRGEYQNGISLGIYNQRYNAEKRKAQIETKGFSPDVLPRFRGVPNYWVDFISQGEVDMDTGVRSIFPDIAVTERQCVETPN